MTMPQRVLSGFVVVLLLGTMWAYQQESAWVDVLAPACKRGHTTKHAPGFAIEQAADGSFFLRTAAGFAHAVAPPAKPVDETWPDLPEVQFSATELLEVLREIRSRCDRSAAESRELAWEHDNFLFSIAG